jgi:hypothetical protein
VSYQTTEAHMAAQAATRAMRDHVANCRVCARARQRGRPAELCHAGAQARTVEMDAAAELAEQKRLDKAECPGQGTLL